MQISDQEKLNLKTCMLVDGYSTYETDFFDSSSYKKLRTTMMDYLPTDDENRLSFEFFPKSEILKAGKFVIDKHFGKLDLRVPFTDGDDMESRLIALFGHNPKPQQYNEIIDYIKNQISLVRVTDIPVYLNTDSEKGGYTSTTWFYSNTKMEEEYYKKLPNCVREIAINGDCDADAKCTYVHEMAHALINRHKGNIRTFLNKEAFSIFMEKVAAQDIDSSGKLLDLESYSRLLGNKYNVLNKEILEFKDEEFSKILKNKTYIFSTLHATALFDTYSKGSKKLQKEIDEALGKVISGEEVLEDVFDYYEATKEKGSKIMQRQIKAYSQRKL